MGRIGRIGLIGRIGFLGGWGNGEIGESGEIIIRCIGFWDRGVVVLWRFLHKH